MTNNENRKSNENRKPVIAEEVNQKDLLTRSEAAFYIGICLASFAKIQNRIPQVRIGRNVRFYKKDIDTYLMENCYERPAQ